MLKYAIAAAAVIVTLFLLTVFQPQTVPLKLELACTPEQWGQGLSGRDSLTSDAGMLFVLSEDKDWSFWMKNTRFPLDIYWIDSAGVITAVEHNLQPCVTIYCVDIRAPCPQPECLSYEHKGKYVLETNVGVLGLKVGNRLNTLSFPVCS